MKLKNTMIFVMAVLAACSEGDPTTQAASQSTNDEAAAELSIYEIAVANTERSDADRQRDAGRKPAEVLAFFGIQPGMSVLDMFSGGGYYTELLSRIVGPEGRVVAHSNNAYASFVGEETRNRYGNNRLPNVEILMAENNELSLPAQAFDAVMLILSYHDIYFVDVANGWPKIDGPQLINELRQSLKPGGILAIVDHHAAAGSPREIGGTLHRIDPEIVISELSEAGFQLQARSQVLRNMEDDYAKSVFDPEVQGNTDRFVFLFRRTD